MIIPSKAVLSVQKDDVDVSYHVVYCTLLYSETLLEKGAGSLLSVFILFLFLVLLVWQNQSHWAMEGNPSGHQSP